MSNDIVSVVSKFVKLQPDGACFVGCCPYHDGQNRSLTVDQTSGYYYCADCGSGGTAAEFALKWNRIHRADD